ncbi:MAG: hypothetical protein JNL58_03850 [Planctomyces sp.]|nr:hypothetical protein [Planctomyces sp.]
MLNSPIHSEFSRTERDTDGELIHAGSPMRLGLLGLIFLSAAVVILVRIWWVQTLLPQHYLESLSTTTTEREPIPARDGRILADGQLFAVDVEEYSIEIHYRWLEEPVNPLWIQQQLRQRLSRKERRDEKLVEKTKHALLEDRSKWKRELQQLCQYSEEKFEEKLRRTQLQVEKIARSVNERHDAKLTAATEIAEHGALMRMAHQVKSALTTPPRREATERIVVREEESWHELIDAVPLSIAGVIAEHPERFPGVRIRSRARRSYPQQSLAAHLIGARTVGSPASEGRGGDTQADETARGVTEKIGRFGVERSYDEWLRGRSGIREIVRNRRQEILSDTIIRQPVSGRDVMLTIEPDLQRHCEELLSEALTDIPRRLLDGPPKDTLTSEEARSASDETTDEPEIPQIVPRGGSVVVMEAATGRILAAASAPTFDPGLFVESSTEEWDRVHSDQRRPFLARFTGMALPPGSTFKTLTAVAAIESGNLNPDEAFQCQGYLRTPDALRCLVYRHYGRGHGPITLRNAMAQSCNVYFFDAAERTGIVSLMDWCERFRIGAATGIDLPFEKSGTTLTHTSAELRDSPPLTQRFAREVTGMAIGQSRLTVTPVQMARLMAAIANGGWLVRPHVVSGEGLARTATEMGMQPTTPERIRIDGLRDSTLTVIREGLIAAIEYPAGTGHKTARIPGYVYGGKTGTAETGGGRPDHAWFAGFAPADSPRYVFVVVLDNGGAGSQAAAPLGREIVRYLKSREGDDRLSQR